LHNRLPLPNPSPKREGQEKSTSISKSSPSLLGEGVGGLRLKTNMRSSA